MTAVVGHTHNNHRPRPKKDQPNPVRTISNNIFEFWRLDPHSFNGGPNLWLLKHGLYTWKAFFYPWTHREQKVPVVAFMFTTEAEHWWHLKKETLSIPTTWDIFLDAFLKSFFTIMFESKWKRSSKIFIKKACWSVITLLNLSSCPVLPKNQ